MLKQELLNKIKRLEIVTTKAVDSLLGGEYHSVFKGMGIHFSDFREYCPGDDIRNIAWSLTAKTGTAHVKTFEEERELSVFLIVDISSSNIFASGERRKIDLSSELGAVLAFSAVKNNDRIGLLTFADRIYRYIPPKKGKKHVMRVVADILSARAGRQSLTDINTALEHINTAQKKRSVVFIISDFMSPYDISHNLKILSNRHDVIALWIFDKSEYELPNVGVVSLRDPETGYLRTVDTSDAVFRQDYKKTIAAYVERQKQIFNEAKVDYLTIETSQDYFKVILNYFKYRKKHRR